jgi:hypothetical protein
MGNLLFSFYSCSKLVPKREDFIGQWKSQSGEVLILKEDSSFVIQQFLIEKESCEFFFNKSSETKIDGEGKWSLIDKKYGKKLHFSFSRYSYDSITSTKGFGITLSFIGSGFFENRLPWQIYDFKGDPDDAPQSTFRKVE